MAVPDAVVAVLRVVPVLCLDGALCADTGGGRSLISRGEVVQLQEVELVLSLEVEVVWSLEVEVVQFLEVKSAAVTAGKSGAVTGGGRGRSLDTGGVRGPVLVMHYSLLIVLHCHLSLKEF